jgi:hypothetical protein
MQNFRIFCLFFEKSFVTLIMTSLTSVGFGNISANTKQEQIFCVFVLLFGALVYATIFGNITTIIQQLHTDTNRYHDAINSVTEFSRQFHVPQELRRVSLMDLGRGRLYEVKICVFNLFFVQTLLTYLQKI